MITTIDCPHCGTHYPVERTCVRVDPGVSFTVVCEVCGNDFDGKFYLVPGEDAREGTPASFLYRWTFGWLGKEAVAGKDAVSPSVDLVVEKRFRL